ncbi:uncharacterized protein LOC122984294 isoform X2 [Thunnus albacares]|uniref:uncharacterized protein LOC122984294 isoform X2 n=1 Tax=Thunnus albacares TaxID=8236 RepID=UPI001CF6FECF|nr:uncharacterized protein LOC122984294 isoform X2 [Thunnus albacares]
MTAERWFYSLALCFMCVSSYEGDFSEHCEIQTLSASPGSSVLLPCNLRKSNLSWVSWVQTPEAHLVNLSSKGRIKFLDPRNGRVKAFPNQGSEGNYSIYIDEFQSSDLGFYCCTQGQDCLVVKLVVNTEDELSEDMKLLIYICVGVAALILLSACSYCCITYILPCDDKNPDYVNNPVGAGVSAPAETSGRGPVGEQQQGADDNNPVYENDAHDPAYVQADPTRNNCVLPGFVHYLEGVQPTQSTSGIHPNECNFERTESKRRKQGFHRELISRLRQASLSRHHYVNQVELNRQQQQRQQQQQQQQQAMSSQAERQHRGVRKKKNKDNHEYQNPIYNRSTDHLNQM